MTKKHGYHNTPTYHSWIGAVQRCTNDKVAQWPLYGGRGIKVCDRWLNGGGNLSAFECFLADMGEKPSDKTLDRVDVNGDYEPSNCRWATVHQQAINRRTTKLSYEDVAQMRRLFRVGLDCASIAEMFDVTAQYVGQIKKHERRAQG